MNLLHRILVATALAGVFPVAARSQCTPTWQAPAGLSVVGDVYCATEWDPDGSGPAGMLLVVGGSFTHCCGVPASNLAAIDLASLAVTTFGPGANARVRALQVGPAGELFVGGAFSSVGGIAANGIASYAAGAFQPLGSGVDLAGGGVLTMAVMANGELAVGGRLQTAGGVPVASVARWDGISWRALGAGLHPNDSWSSITQEPGGVRRLVATPNGLVAFGLFDASGSTPMLDVASWDGTAWSAVGAFPPGAFVSRIDGTVLTNGDLVACGNAIFFAPNQFVLRWDGVAWTSLPLPSQSPNVVAGLPNGDLVAGCSVIFGSSSVERWTGSSWQVLGSVLSSVIDARPLSVTPTPSLGLGSFVLGGHGITSMSGVAGLNLMLHLDGGVGWIGDSTAFAGSGPRLHAQPSGEVFVTGAGAIGPTALPGLGRWNGSLWQPVAGSPNGLTRVADDLRGGLVATDGSQVWRYDGAQWTALPPLSTVGLALLLALPNGDLLVGNPGSSCYRWNGAWQPFSATPEQVILHPDGRVIAAGFLGTLPVWSRVGAYDSTTNTWQDLDPQQQLAGAPYALAVLPGGTIVAGGSMSFGGFIAAFDGTTWVTMGAGFDGPVERLAVLADGTLVAGGSFTASGATPCAGIAIWNGTAWQAAPGAPPTPRNFAALPNGELWAISAGRSLARWTTPCAAQQLVGASTCSSANDTAPLQLTDWPLVGGWLRGRSVGLPAGVAALVCGQPMPSLSLSSLFAAAAPGCGLVVAPELLLLLPAVGGYAAFELPLPSTPVLLGAGFATQVVGLGLSPTLDVTFANSSAPLQLTIGSRQ